jgi:hypothetical protein
MTRKSSDPNSKEAGVRHVGTSSWLVTSRMWRTRYLWCRTFSSPMNNSEVPLTLLLMDTYITLMIWIGHLIRLSLTRFESTALTIMTIPLTLFALYLLLLVRLGDYTVNLYVLCSYRLLGKLTAFFAASGVQLAQSNSELFHFRRTTLSSQLSSLKSGAPSSRLQLYVLILTLTGRLS